MKTILTLYGKKILTHILVSGIILTPVILFAQGSTADIGLKNPVKVNSISDLILIVTRVVRYIAIPFIVVAIMWAGFLFILNAVAPSTSGKMNAKSVLLYTVIGAFILLSSELIALVMRNTIEGLTN